MILLTSLLLFLLVLSLLFCRPREPQITFSTGQQIVASSEQIRGVASSEDTDLWEQFENVETVSSKTRLFYFGDKSVSFISESLKY